MIQINYIAGRIRHNSRIFCTLCKCSKKCIIVVLYPIYRKRCGVSVRVLIEHQIFIIHALI